MKKSLTIFYTILMSFGVLNAQEEKPLESEVLPAIEKNSFHGYWIADESAIASMLMIERKSEIDSGSVTKEEIEKMAKKFSSMMVMHYSADGSTSMYTVSGVKKGKYKIIAVRKNEREIDIDISSETDGVELGTLQFTKDQKMMLSARSDKKNAPKITFKKVAKEKALPMIKAIQPE